MNFSRFSRFLVAGAMSASLLAGCSAGSQFTPAAQPATTAHAADVRPAMELPPNMAIVWWNRICFYYVSPTTGIWHLMYCFPIFVRGFGGWGGREWVISLTDGNLDLYYGKRKLVGELTGMSGATTGLVMDKAGNVFATNPGTSEVVEFASGSSTPTATFTDPNLSSATYLAMDKANRLYVEGQSASSGNGIEVDTLAGSTFEPLAKPGSLGATAGGLAVQTSGKTTYVWINDQGTPSGLPSIARYVIEGSGMVEQGSFNYSGINGAIAVDPSGKDTTNVYAVNNVPSGSEYSVSGVTYSYPTGTIVSTTGPQTSSQESAGIAMR